MKYHVRVLLSTAVFPATDIAVGCRFVKGRTAWWRGRWSTEQARDGILLRLPLELVVQGCCARGRVGKKVSAAVDTECTACYTRANRCDGLRETRGTRSIILKGALRRV